MTVGLGGEPAGLSSFMDSFARPDQPFYFGNNWYTCVVPTSGAHSGATIASAINVIANALVLGQVANLGTLALAGIPRGVFPPSIVTKPQFAQMVLAATGGTSIATGPAVMVETNGDNGYVARTVNNGGVRDIVIARGLGTGSTQIGVQKAVALGSTIRIEVRPSGPSNDVRLVVNGVTVDTVIDANAGRPTQGMFGIGYLGANNSTDTWTNFSAGII